MKWLYSETIAYMPVRSKYPYQTGCEVTLHLRKILYICMYRTCQIEVKLSFRFQVMLPSTVFHELLFVSIVPFVLVFSSSLNGNS